MEKNIEYSQEEINLNKLDFLEKFFLENQDKVGKEAEIKFAPGYEIVNGVFKKKKIKKSIKKQKGKAKIENNRDISVDSNKFETKRIMKNVAKKGKLIFDGEIEDIRYDDKFTKANGYYLIRIRHLKGKELNPETGKMVEVDKYQLTVKKEGKNKAEAQEFEKTYNSKEEIENILEGNGFIAQKRYKKTRKEFKVNFDKNDNKKPKLNLENKYTKFAFDKYLDYSEEEKKKLSEENPDVKLLDYASIPHFLEIESPDGKDYSLAGAKKFGLENLANMTSGPKKAKEKYVFIDKVGQIPLKKFNNLINAIVVNLFSNREYQGGLLNGEEKERYNEISKNIKKSLRYLIIPLKNNFKKLISENPKYLKIFGDLIYEKNDYLKKNKNFTNLNFKNIKINNFSEKEKIYDFTDKFFNKIDNYIDGYEIAILNSIKKKLDKKEEINDDVIKNILKNELKSFLNLLFVFGNNLNKEQLEELLTKNTLAENKILFNKLKSDIEELFNCEKIENIEKFSIEKMIRTLISEQFFDNQKIKKNNKKNGENKEEIKLEENIEEHILDSFQMLAKDFSTWLNSPKNKDSSKDKFINNLKETWKDLFKTIEVLKGKSFAFQNLDNSNIQTILNNKEFSTKIFDKKNFSLGDVEGGIEKEQELLIRFLENINSDEDIIGEIRDEMLDFNEQRIIEILDKEAIYGEENIKINDFEKIVNGDNFDVSKISYSLWKSIPYNLKFTIYVKHILGNYDKFEEIYSEILNPYEENSEKINAFIKEVYKNKFKKDYSEIDINSRDFINYKIKILEQIKTAENIFKNKNDSEKISKLFETNKNDSDLLVAWLRFNFKYEQAKKENKNIEEMHISSQNFIEQTILNLGDEVKKGEYGKNKIGAEIILGTTESHNTSGWNADYIKIRWRRAIEKGLIQTNKSFYIEDEKGKRFFKNIEELYLPSKDELSNGIEEGVNTKTKNNNYYNKTIELINEGIDFCRKISNGEYIDEKSRYFKILEKVNFPYKDSAMINRLKIFLQFSLDVAEKTNDMIFDCYDDKDFLDEYFDNNEFKKELNLGEGEIFIGDVKGYDRSFAKNNGKYAGNISKIGDLTRMMIVKDSFEELTKTASEFIKYAGGIDKVKQIWIEDSIGNLFEKAPKKASGYRDAKMMLVLDNGNTVEVQFHLKEFAEVKKYGVNLDDKLEKNIFKELDFIQTDEENENLEENKKENILDMVKNKIEKFYKKLFKSDNVLDKEEIKHFNLEEKQDILNIIKNKNLLFPENFYKNILKIENKDEYKNNILTNKKYYKEAYDREYNSKKDKNIENNIIDDYLYNIGRILSEDKNKKITQIKIETIQNCLYDTAGGKMAKKEAKRIIEKN